MDRAAVGAHQWTNKAIKMVMGRKSIALSDAQSSTLRDALHYTENRRLASANGHLVITSFGNRSANKSISERTEQSI